MLRIKHVILLIALLTLVGCATIKTNYVDSAGRSLPNPSYKFQIIGEPISIMFYYTAYEEVKDVDGSIILKPIYLDLLLYHYLNTKKIKGVTLTIEVNNPEGLEYSLYQKIDMKLGADSIHRTAMQKVGEVNRSNLPYRQFVYYLPFDKEVREVDSLVLFYLGDREVAQIGNFKYNLDK